ncbi:NAD-dependent epimerase/dehydratase family protein [Labilibacter sediminis]|nr:NAD-dependent epimerase/dehydratase family protein [Labilibacter sediminis]
MIQIDKTKPVLVTGATGYVAGVLMKKLLSEGLTVHAPIRNPEDKEKTRYLDTLVDNYPGNIRYFKADLLQNGSYDEAMQGCELVFHTASPFVLNVKDAQKDLVDPALKGTQNVLTSVNKTSSVKKVILTSSVAAIYGDNKDIQQAKNGVLTEEDWNTSSSLKHQPYSYSKTVAEKEAWKIHDEQKRWRLVVINPSFVLGAGINPNATSESYHMFRQIFDGSMKGGAPDFRLGMVDVRDVAEAHFQAGFNPDAEGRHIVSAETSGFMGIVDILNVKYKGQYPFPQKTVPKFMVWLLAPLVGFKRKMIKNNIGYSFAADNSKSVNQLGIRYRPLKDTIMEFFEYLVSHQS